MVTPLNKRLLAQGRQGVTGARDQATGKMLMWHRDIGNSWQLLVHEAMTAANEALGRDPEVFEILSAISKGLKAIYVDSLEDNYKGMAGFREIYDYIDEKGELGHKAYSTFSTFLVQTMFCFLFTSRKMAIGLPQDIESSRLHEVMDAVNIMSVLDDDLRIKVMQQFRDRGVWPTTLDCASLLRRLEGFRDTMLEDYEAHTQEVRDKAKATQEKGVQKKAALTKRKPKNKQAKASRRKNRK